MNPIQQEDISAGRGRNPVMNHCNYCLGITLRDYDKKRVQCMACFCVGPPLVIRRDRSDCPICFEDVFVGNKLVVPPGSAIESNLAKGECPGAIAVCSQCSIFVCRACTEKMGTSKCPQCSRKGMTIGFTTDTTPFDPMSDDLRDLLADLAMIYLRKYPENGCMLWETIVEYTKWLSIIKDVPDDPNAIYSPCKDIDKLWHLHILCTKNYAAVCEILCGQMINHRPVFESDSDRLKRFTAAVTAIRRIEPFTKKTADMWGIPLQSPAFNYAPVGMVFIKMLSGRTEKVDYHPKYTIGDLLIKCDIYCVSASIIFAGKSLKLDETCEYYNVDHGSTIHHALSLRGC